MVKYNSRVEKEFPLSYNHGESNIKPQFILEKLNEIVKKNSIIVTDVGQHQMWAAQYLTF